MNQKYKNYSTRAKKNSYEFHKKRRITRLSTNPFSITLSPEYTIDDVGKIFFYYYTKQNPKRNKYLIYAFVNCIFSEKLVLKKEKKKMINKNFTLKTSGTQTIISKEELLDLLLITLFLREKKMFFKNPSNREITRAFLSFFNSSPIKDRAIREQLSNLKIDKTNYYHLNFILQKIKKTS